MPEGFLAVSSRPSASLPLSEYHEWYEEEHIPIRLNRLPSFLSGARYQAVDLEQPGAEEHEHVKPSWLAIYEIASTDTFQDPSYTSLREKRSEREKDVMSRLDVLVRLTAELVGVWGEAEGKRSTGLKLDRPSGVVVTHGLDIRGTEDKSPDEPDQLVKTWAEGVHKDLQNKYKTWVRMRAVRVLDSGKAKLGKAVNLREDERSAYFIIHGAYFERFPLKTSIHLYQPWAEFAGEEDAVVDAFSMSSRTSTGSTLFSTKDCRIWKLYKAYPCIAQGNLEA